MKTLRNLVFLLILGSCGIPKNVVITNDPYLNSYPISFIVLGISKDSIIEKSNIKLINKINNSGKLKLDDNNFINNSSLKIISYFKSKMIATTIIEHPLYQNIEYVNENKQFERKLVKREKAEFFIRIQGEVTTLKIYEKINGKELNEILIKL